MNQNIVVRCVSGQIAFETSLSGFAAEDNLNGKVFFVAQCLKTENPLSGEANDYKLFSSKKKHLDTYFVL